MKKNVITTIEVNDFHIKLIRSDIVKGKRVIDLCVVQELKDNSDIEIIKIVEDMIKANNIDTEDLRFIIPRRLAILKQLNLPSHNEDEIKKMLGLQLVSQLPYALEDITYDYKVIGKNNNGYSNVLVFILHKEVNEKYSKLLSKAGISSENFTISTIGIWDWVSYQESKKTIDTQKSTAILDIDMAHSEICFFHEGKLLFSRSIKSGAIDIKNESVTTLIKQIELSLKAYKTDNMGPALSKIVILSSLPELLSLRSRIENDLDISVTLMSPLDNILCKKSADLSIINSSTGISPTVSFGLHMSDAKQVINLTPKEVIDTKASKLTRYYILRAIMLCFILALMIVSIFAVRLMKKQGYLKQVENTYKSLKSQVGDAQHKIDLVTAMNDELNNRVFVPDVIRELIRLTPENISLRFIYIDERRTLTVQGYANDRSSVNVFQNNLVQSKEFRGVDLQFATERRTYNMELTDFKLSAQIKDNRAE